MLPVTNPFVCELITGLMRGDPLNNSRRTHSSSVHTVGGWAGPAGTPAANGSSTALTRLDTKPPTYVTTVLGSYAVGQSRKDGTRGGVTAVVTAVVTAAVFICTVDDNVCAATELASTSEADMAVGAGSLSTFTSTAATLLSGALDALV